MADDHAAMLTPEQVADWLQVTLNTVYRWVREGELPALRIGRLYRIPRADVLAMIERRGQGQDAEPKEE